MVLNIIEFNGFFSSIPKKEKSFEESVKQLLSYLPWKQIYGLCNQNEKKKKKTPSILTYSYKQQTFEYIGRLNDHLRDSSIWKGEGLPSNTWCNAKQI